MKTQYKKTYRYNSDDDFYYGTRYHYCRPIRTSGELRAHAGVKAEEELRDMKIYPRACRNRGNLDSWNDFMVSRNYKKSWKDFTKNHKQWVRTPAPQPYFDGPKWRKSDQSEIGLPDLCGVNA